MLKARWPFWAFLLLTVIWEAVWAFGFRKECAPWIVEAHAPVTSETCGLSFPEVYVGHGMYWVFGPPGFALAGPLIIAATIGLLVGVARLTRRRSP